MTMTTMGKNTLWTFLGISLLLHAALVLWLALLPAPHSARGGAVMEVTIVSSPGQQAEALNVLHASPSLPGVRKDPTGDASLRPSASPPKVKDDSPVAENGAQAGPAAAPVAQGVADAQPTGGESLHGQTAPAQKTQGTGEASIQSYSQLILNIIRRNPFYPDSARRKGIEGSVDVQVTIDRKGQASNIRVVRTSGSSALDRASVQTIRGCSFPPPPAESITLPITITFRLVEGS